jgi:lysozyme
MKKGCLIALTVLLAIGAVGLIALYWLFFVPHGIEIDKQQYPITGIDVSNHTGKIDFKQLKAQSIDFVYLKATEGANYTDPSFETNYKGVKAQRIPVGAYHFFRFNKPGDAQAEVFLAAIRQKKLDLPLVLDVEEWGNFGKKNKSSVINEIAVFIREVEKRTGRKIMLYSNESGYKTYLAASFPNQPIWICSFSNPPEIKSKWTFWQHSHKGKLKGTEGYVDLNTFNGGLSAWKAFLGG